MAKVVIIGCGGVGTVVAHKCAQNHDVFSEIIIASRTQSKCDAVARVINKPWVSTDRVDADNVDDVVALFERHKPDLVINVALPYQDLTIMDACLRAGVNYLDTANYEPKDEAHFEYSWQWAYRERFEKAGLTAILGCGFDPGVSGVFTAYAAKHWFSAMETLDIVDCNAGNHGKAFATNFNPEINIREITQNGRYYQDGKWITTGPLEIHQDLTYSNIGPRDSYLMYHEELESLVQNFPTIRRARFWMTFGQEYLTHLYRPMQELGREVYDEMLARHPELEVNLKVTRGTIMVILVIAAAVAILVPGAMINDFGFLSMGLRGAVVFLPMCGGLWLKGKIPSRFALAAIIAGPIAVLAGKLLAIPFDPLFLGMAVCLVIMSAGLLSGKHNNLSLSSH